MGKKNGQDPALGGPGMFATALRKYRILAGYSQREVATILRMSRSTYTYYETGRTAPDPDTLNRIAKIFGIPMEFFFDVETLSTLSDSLPAKKRPFQKKYPNPSHIGELTTDEKLIIAYLRDKGLSAEAVFHALRKRFDSLP